MLKSVLPSECLANPLIPFGKGFNKDLAQFYSNKIDKIKSRRQIFLKNMTVFIPKIESIIVDTEKGSIIIEENDQELFADSLNLIVFSPFYSFVFFIK